MPLLSTKKKKVVGGCNFSSQAIDVVVVKCDDRLMNKSHKTWVIQRYFSPPWKRWRSACCCILWVFCAAGPVSAAPLFDAHPPAASRLWSARRSDPEGRWTGRRWHQSPPPPGGLSRSSLRYNKQHKQQRHFIAFITSNVHKMSLTLLIGEEM